jgi:hypothetical protein
VRELHLYRAWLTLHRYDSIQVSLASSKTRTVKAGPHQVDKGDILAIKGATTMEDTMIERIDKDHQTNIPHEAISTHHEANSIHLGVAHRLKCVDPRRMAHHETTCMTDAVLLNLEDNYPEHILNSPPVKRDRQCKLLILLDKPTHARLVDLWPMTTSR